MTSIGAHHAEWLSLVDVSGPFLSVSVLKEALPNGLDAHDPHIAAEVREALDNWMDPDGAGLGSVDDVDIHLAFMRFVFHEVLGFDDDVLRWDREASSRYTVEVPHVGVLTPDAVVIDGDDAAMLVSVVGPGVRVDEIANEAGAMTAQERMVEHLKATGLRVGLVTDGERWTLVSYQEGASPGFATWWSSFWGGEEKITLQAFRTLLRQDRFLSMGADETIAGLLDRSAQDQREVTTKLGNQTLEAVEILIRTIDRIDHERGAQLLAEVPVEELYDAAVTVMMRLIFLFYAEENDLLPVAEPLYNNRYAASTLRDALQAAADEHGEEVLESTHDGWPRLLATWRAVFGGVEHGEMVLAPYGGSLFDPDRYPFLEGRQPDTCWTIDEADALPIDNRTVLHLLNALQTLEEGGQRRKLSFRALDVEQIGHVYEGMLDHTGVRAEGWVLGLSGTGGREPEIDLDRLDSLDEKALLDFLKEQTGRTPTTLKQWVCDSEADKAVTKFGVTWAAAFAGSDLATRARRFAKLIRPDSTGAPTVFQPGSVYVADSSHRGATGTHYTPRSLTEEVVKHTLDPLVYISPADGAAEDEWELRSPEEILNLKICDPACGSGAFLVQACRYLADAVVEANRTHGRRSDPITEDEIIDARRQVAERCLHGVDINPMACEMAKLSLWLITLAHDRPFTFLDHAIRNGDSLVGLSSRRQLETLRLGPPQERGGPKSLFDTTASVQAATTSAAAEWEKLRSLETESLSIRATKRALLENIEVGLESLERVADRVVGVHWALLGMSSRDGVARLAALDEQAANVLTGVALYDVSRQDTNYFHWPLEFPDVFVDNEDAGFDAVIGNPPFMAGVAISQTMGSDYNSFLASFVGGGSLKVELCVYFLLRSAHLVKSTGRIGLVATKTIAEGVSRKAGLDHLEAEHFVIYRARTRFHWPGSAAVVVSLVWLAPNGRGDRCVLDGAIVKGISPLLEPIGSVAGAPKNLPANFGLAFTGSSLRGEGFFVDAGEAQAMRLSNPSNEAVVKKALGGRELNNNVDLQPSRWIIDMGERTETEASTFAEPFEWLRTHVLPQRSVMDPNKYKRIVDGWWKFWHPRLELYEGIRSRGLSRVLVRARLSDHHMVAWAETESLVFTEQVIVFLLDRWEDFGVLQSSVHDLWSRRYASRMKEDVRYLPPDCFETFSRPPYADEVAIAAEVFYQVRLNFMTSRGLGLTKTHNALHAGADGSQALAKSIAVLDGAVCKAYGWSDLELDHGFHRTERGVRFTVSPKARDELLDRLLARNHELARSIKAGSLTGRKDK